MASRVKPTAAQKRPPAAQALLNPLVRPTPIQEKNTGTSARRNRTWAAEGAHGRRDAVKAAIDGVLHV
jgi:hypothetical protein